MKFWKRKPIEVDAGEELDWLANESSVAQLGDGRRKRVIGGRNLGLVGFVALLLIGGFLLLSAKRISVATAAPDRTNVVESPKLNVSAHADTRQKAAPETAPEGNTPPQQQQQNRSPVSTTASHPKPAASSEPDVISSSTGYRGPPALVEVAQTKTEPDAWDQRLRSSMPPIERASLIENPELTLGGDTMIACRLDSYVQSDQPGPISCHTIEDVWSLTHTVKLMEAGTKVSGRQTDPLTQGKTNVFAVWDYALTPNYVYVPMHSPVVGPLGQAGMTGYVDTHFRERFGGTIMLSLISDFGQALANSQQNRGDGVSFSNTSRGAQDAASLALENSINIAPTFHKLPGEIVHIRMRGARSFLDVYDLVAR